MYLLFVKSFYMNLKVVKMLLILFEANVIFVESNRYPAFRENHDKRNLGEHKRKFFRKVLSN